MTPLLDLLRRAGAWIGKVLIGIALAAVALAMMTLDWCASLIGGP